MSGSSVVNPFKNLLNFRQVTVQLEKYGTERKLKLYRSSRPDLLTAEEIDTFKALGINSIVDFRSTSDYKKAKPSTKLIDKDFTVYKVKIPHKKFQAGSSFEMTQVKSGKPCNNQSIPKLDDHGRHFFIDFFKINYIYTVFMRAPWYMRLYSLLLLAIDFVLRTHNYKYFVRCFARNILNPAGLISQYIDFLNLSQASIYAGLTLLCDPANTPASINCAHGKDRTGVVCALIQHINGASIQQIAADYAQSEVNLAPIADRVREEICVQLHMSETFLQTKEKTMIDLFAYIENTWGSVSNYLESIGFGEDAQDKLRKNLSL